MIEAKPLSWNIQKGLVAPEVQWAWEHTAGVYVMWKGGGAPRNVSGLGVDMALPGGTADPTWSVDKHGIVTVFDGSDDYFVEGSDFNLFDASTNLSVEAYVLTDTLTGGGADLRYVVSQEGGTRGVSSFMMRMNTGTDRMEFFIGGSAYSSAVSPSNSVLVDIFQHWIGQYDGTNVELWLGGALQQQTPRAGGTGTPDSSGRLLIGEYDGNGSLGRPWSGLQSFVVLRTRTLSAGEIKARAANPLGMFHMDLRRIGFVAAAPPGARPQGPLGHPLHGPFAGPIN